MAKGTKLWLFHKINQEQQYPRDIISPSNWAELTTVGPREYNVEGPQNNRLGHMFCPWNDYLKVYRMVSNVSTVTKGDSSETEPAMG